MLKKSNQKGFSIIEVLIVLAIAGLIMLIVFLAVPALRRNSANTGRDNDASKISAAVTDCLNNHNGLPASCSTIGATAIDVTGLSQLTGTTNTPFGNATGANGAVVNNSTQLSAGNDPDASNYVIRYKAKCNDNGDNTMVVSSNTRDFAVAYNVKSSGGVTLKCIGS